MSSVPPSLTLEDRFSGLLLGTALGDALGLPMEGMRAGPLARHFPQIDRFFILGRIGFVSDDTEQSALIAQSLSSHPQDVERCVRSFRRSLLGWFLRLPWGIGFGTLRACCRIAFGFRTSGVFTAGNGAAMRAAPIGAVFFDDLDRRSAFSTALARVTHTDPRAVDGARFVAEVAAQCIAPRERSCSELLRDSLHAVQDRALLEALTRAIDLAASGQSADSLGSTGFVIHSVPLAAFMFGRHGAQPMAAISATIAAGGDTDTNAAIVGAWVGALHGAASLSTPLLAEINDGPFGPTHLKALAADLAGARLGRAPQARYAWAVALIRNLAMYPVVLAHAVRLMLTR
jgi:ADP-ribosyl-[dinitrogen reductase] hydrolase